MSCNAFTQRVCWSTVLNSGCGDVGVWANVWKALTGCRRLPGGAAGPIPVFILN